MGWVNRGFAILCIDVHKGHFRDKKCRGGAVVSVVNCDPICNRAGSLVPFLCRKREDRASANGVMETDLIEGNCDKAALRFGNASGNPRAFIDPRQHASAKQMTVLIEIGWQDQTVSDRCQRGASEAMNCCSMTRWLIIS